MAVEDSVSFKVVGRAQRDTRNNWVTLMFVTKYRFNCFRKQSHIDTCTAAFREFEAVGFEFGNFGFAGTHVHFLVNIPKRYSVTVAEIMLKARSAQRIFAAHPGFRKRYPHGSFWSGYEHHESTGRKDYATSAAYICDQARHHGVTVIDDRQQTLSTFADGRDAARPSEARA